MDFSEVARLQALKAKHAAAKEHWYSLLAQPRDDLDYFEELKSASAAYTAAAEAHLAFWEPASPV